MSLACAAVASCHGSVGGKHVSGRLECRAYCIYACDLDRLGSLFSLRLVPSSIELADEAFFATLVFQAGLVLPARLGNVSTLMDAKLERERKGSRTGASSRMKMLQYLHQYCFLEIQYLEGGQRCSKSCRPGVEDTHSVILVVRGEGGRDEGREHD